MLGDARLYNTMQCWAVAGRRCYVMVNCAIPYCSNAIPCYANARPCDSVIRVRGSNGRSLSPGAWLK
eukprot:1599980-Pyramimonas_sp.AAC.1